MLDGLQVVKANLLSCDAANPYWVAPAYKKTQPDPKLAEEVYEDDDEAQRAAAKKRRQ